MSTLLLDTNIVSYLIKGDTRADLYASHLLDQELAISLMTVAELFQWAASRNWGPARLQQLEEKLLDYTILPIDFGTCRLWAAVRVQCRNSGHLVSSQDAWIAATALQYGLSLVTHNSSDFQPVVGLTIITETGE